MPLLPRLALVVVIAAIMALVGFTLLERTQGLYSGPAAHVFAALASVVLWVPFSWALRHTSLSVTVGLGIISPFIGSLAFCPPVSTFYVAGCPETLAVGAVTALLIRAIESYRVPLEMARLRRGLCPMCGYDLRRGRSDRCPECGFAPPIRRPNRHTWLAVVVMVMLFATVACILPLIAIGFVGRDRSLPSEFFMRFGVTAAILLASALWILTNLRRGPALRTLKNAA